MNPKKTSLYAMIGLSCFLTIKGRILSENNELTDYALALAWIAVSLNVPQIMRDIASLKVWTWYRVYLTVFVFAIASYSIYASTTLFMVRQNSDYMRLMSVKSEMESKKGQMDISDRQLTACNPLVVKGCQKPRLEAYNASVQAYNLAHTKYAEMIKAATKEMSNQVWTETTGLSLSQIFLVNSLAVCVFLELMILFCAVKFQDEEERKSLDSRLTEEYPQVNESESLKKTVNKLKNRNDLTPLQTKALDVYEQWESQGRILPNGMPGLPSQFAVAVFGAGKQGGTYTRDAIAYLLTLELISVETYRENLLKEGV